LNGVSKLKKKNSKFKAFTESPSFKTLVLSLKTCFAGDRCDMNLVRHQRPNLERFLGQFPKSCRSWAAK